MDGDKKEGDCITIVTSDGVKIKSFGSLGDYGEIVLPEGVAITSKGTILLADYAGYSLSEFTMDGELVSKIGNVGGLIPSQSFFAPYDIAINKTGMIYITDAVDDYVKVLNLTKLINIFPQVW